MMSITELYPIAEPWIMSFMFALSALTCLISNIRTIAEAEKGGSFSLILGFTGFFAYSSLLATPIVISLWFFLIPFLIEPLLFGIFTAVIEKLTPNNHESY